MKSSTTFSLIIFAVLSTFCLATSQPPLENNNEVVIEPVVNQLNLPNSVNNLERVGKVRKYRPRPINFDYDVQNAKHDRSGYGYEDDHYGYEDDQYANYYRGGYYNDDDNSYDDTHNLQIVSKLSIILHSFIIALYT